MTEQVPLSDVVARRLAAQHLTERLGEDTLPDAAAGCGIQNSPPGSALLALHARVRGVTRAAVDHAVAEQNSLLQTWSMRGAPFYVPTADAAIFTTGVLPPSEEALRRFLPGVAPALDALGLTLTEAAELTRTEIRDVLAGRRLAVQELGAELAGRIAGRLTAKQRRRWTEEGPYAAGQPLGEGVVHFCLRVLTLEGVVCFAPRSGNKAPFVLVDEWLGHPLPGVDPRAARAELLRRYLHCYGPSTRAGFAAWTGLQVRDTDPWWDAVEGELTPVRLTDAGRDQDRDAASDGSRDRGRDDASSDAASTRRGSGSDDGAQGDRHGSTAWIRTNDLDALRSPPSPTGVRLLPPRDPYTQLHDRESILDQRWHREVWKTVGEPGTLLVDGVIAGIWRPRKIGRRLTLTVTTFASLTEPHRRALHAEAEEVAPLRGASSVTVAHETF